MKSLETKNPGSSFFNLFATHRKIKREFIGF